MCCDVSRSCLARVIETTCPPGLSAHVRPGSRVLALELSVPLSSGHWHRDDTRRTGVQSRNHRQVGVKGKPPPPNYTFLGCYSCCPLRALESVLKAAPTREGRTQQPPGTSNSRNVLGCQLCGGAVGALYPSQGPLRWFLFLIDEEVKMSTLSIARNRLTPGSKSESGMYHSASAFSPSLSDCLRWRGLADVDVLPLHP